VNAITGKYVKKYWKNGKGGGGSQKLKLTIIAVRRKDWQCDEEQQ